MSEDGDYDVDDVDFHSPFLKKSYKKICRTCIRNAYPVPLYFELMGIPDSYGLSEKQIKSEYRKLSKECRLHLIGLLNIREETVMKIEEGVCRDFDSLDDFVEWEMFRFVNKFPDFAFVFNPNK